MIDNVKDINKILSKHNVLIVHFSGSPKGSGIYRENHLYPNDLLHVLAGNAQGGISCSTVNPNDCFSGFNRNATGCIGLIIRLNSPASLIDVSNTDCGSIECGNGYRTTHRTTIINIEEIESSIINRCVNGYNEWVVKDYEIIGILALEPYEVIATKKTSCLPGLPKHLWNDDFLYDIECLSIDKVISDFPKYKVYSFYKGKIVNRSNNEMQYADHSDLYDLSNL